MKISELRCYRCERNDRALFRVSARGEPGVWACEECLPPDKAPDPEVKEIVDIIGGPKPPIGMKSSRARRGTAEGEPLCERIQTFLSRNKNESR